MKSKYLYIDILNKLNNEGVGFECEIISLFNIKDAVNDKCGPIGLLETMKENKHITYTDSYDEKDFNQPLDANKMPLISIMASITFPGMEYLMKHDLTIKTKNSLRIQAIFSALSIIVLAISVYISARLILADQSVLKSLNTLQLKSQLQQLEIIQLKDSLSTWSKSSKDHANTILQKNANLSHVYRRVR
jgi:hypothetical protein